MEFGSRTALRRGEGDQGKWLRGHLAHEVALADLDAETAQDVVCRGCVKIEIRHCEVVEVVLGAEVARLTALGNRHLRVFPAVELVGLEALQEIDRLVDPRLHFGKAVVDGGKFGHRDAGGASGAEGVLARLTHLAGEGEHVGMEPPIEQRILFPLVCSGVRLGFFDDSLEATEQLQKYRHGGVVHRDRHETVLLINDGVDAARILTGAESRGKAPAPTERTLEFRGILTSLCLDDPSSSEPRTCTPCSPPIPVAAAAPPQSRSSPSASSSFWRCGRQLRPRSRPQERRRWIARGRRDVTSPLLSPTN